ncbi:DUF72 domain-containing protein [Blastococcus atacamensis]|uniref:DUF72 domain-containing protein n=1 Tax=Blastococcus atacamensis TaxID=2070508 RepID=UPI0018E47218|nr:DUF72 domain-containing protein [Blastococcus atacamensis]
MWRLVALAGQGLVLRGPAGLPCVPRATAPFVHVRMHGPDHEHLDGGSYSDDDLRWPAVRVGEWRADGREVDVYFTDDGHGHAVRDADRLRELAGS